MFVAVVWYLLSKYFSGNRKLHNGAEIDFRGSSFNDGGTLLLLYDKGTLYMWSGEGYIGVAFKDIFKDGNATKYFSKCAY